jgi:hypothetical protein
MNVDYFLHLPKCGGSTLRVVAERQYSVWQTIDLYDYWYVKHEEMAERLKRELEARADRPRPVFVEGHIPFGIHRVQEEGSRFRYFTMLREPSKRAGSLWRGATIQKRHPFHPQIASGEMDMRAFFMDSEFLDLDNGMTRRLADPELAATRGFGEVDSALFDSAMENLEHPQLVCGVTDQFDLSLHVIGEVMGWKGNLRYFRERQGPQAATASIPSEVAQRIRDLTEWDLRLYEAAKAKLQRIAGDKDVTARLAHFSDTNEGIRRGALLPGIARVKAARYTRGARRRVEKQLGR